MVGFPDQSEPLPDYARQDSATRQGCPSGQDAKLPGGSDLRIALIPHSKNTTEIIATQIDLLGTNEVKFVSKVLSTVAITSEWLAILVWT
jgi:hypothetical protein